MLDWEVLVLELNHPKQVVDAVGAHGSELNLCACCELVYLIIPFNNDNRSFLLILFHPPSTVRLNVKVIHTTANYVKTQIFSSQYLFPDSSLPLLHFFPFVSFLWKTETGIFRVIYVIIKKNCVLIRSLLKFRKFRAYKGL